MITRHQDMHRLSIQGSNDSGCPDISFQIYKKVANAPHRGKAATHHAGSSQPTEKPKSMPRYEAKSEEGRLWTGWKTALKPAHEPILVFQKPIDGTYANNALVHGVAGFNIDGSRIGDEEVSVHNAPTGTFAGGEPGRGSDTNYRHHQGRYPANVILDDVAAERVGEPSRFFYLAKPSRKEKDTGLDDMPKKLKVYNGTSNTPMKNMNSLQERWTTHQRNHHPTVKPISLIRYLCRLSKTPSDGNVLDLFMGSGTTGLAALQEERDFIGIEIDKEYFQIAEKRMAYYMGGELQVNAADEYQMLEF